MKRQTDILASFQRGIREVSSLTGCNRSNSRSTVYLTEMRLEAWDSCNLIHSMHCKCILLAAFLSEHHDQQAVMCCRPIIVGRLQSLRVLLPGLCRASTVAQDLGASQEIRLVTLYGGLPVSPQRKHPLVEALKVLAQHPLRCRPSQGYKMCNRKQVRLFMHLSS